MFYIFVVLHEFLKHFGFMLKRAKFHHQPSDGSKRPTMSDALEYLKEVKEEFNNFPEKYNQFLVIFKAFHAKRFVLPFIKLLSSINTFPFSFLN